MTDMEEAIAFAVEKYNRLYDTSIDKLKTLQQEVIRNIIKGHTIGMLPTGYGKSLCYELLPDIVDSMFKQATFVIVIVPLNVILSQQIEKLGTKAICLTNEYCQKLSNDAERLKWTQGHYQFLFCHPEQIIGNNSVREILLHTFFQEEVRSFIIIDEAHCILDWGVEFRPIFAKLGILRALLPNANVLALSATLSVDGRKEVAKKLGITHYQSVCKPPARDNIALIVNKRPTESSVQQAVESVIEPLLTELLVKQQSFPLTVVYFGGSQDWVGRSYELAERMLGKKMFCGGSELQHTRVVQFHASMEKTGNKIKSTILQNLAADPATSPLKIVLATIALGMGADLQHVQRVVNIGPPKRIENYVQQIGRAGRSGQQSWAILFYNNTDIGRPQISQQMKDLCKNNTVCRRKQVNEAFGFKTASNVAPEICCDVCNSDLASPYELSLTPETKGVLLKLLTDYISRDDTNYLREKLPVSAIHQIITAPDMFSRELLVEHFQLSDAIAESLDQIITQVKNLSASCDGDRGVKIQEGRIRCLNHNIVFSILDQLISKMTIKELP